MSDPMFQNLSPLRFVKETEEEIREFKISDRILRPRLEAFQTAILASPVTGIILDRLDLPGCEPDAGLYAFPIPFVDRGVPQLLDLTYLWLSYWQNVIVIRARSRALHEAPVMTGLTPSEVSHIKSALAAVHGD